MLRACPPQNLRAKAASLGTSSPTLAIYWRGLWRAVDDEGEVFDCLIQKRRNTMAAMRLFGKLLKNTGIAPEVIHTDRLASYRAARELGISRRHRPGRMIGNNRAENSHLAIRRRERKQ
jgi:putative transposase